MNFEKSVHVLTVVALVLGLMVVVAELRQNRDAILAENTSSGFNRYSLLNIASLGEQPLSVLAKACEQPGELSVEDLMLLDIYYFELLTRVRSQMLISQQTDLSRDWQARSHGNFKIILQSAPGRAWWKITLWEPEIQEMGDRVLAMASASSCLDHFQEFRDKIRIELDDV